MAYANGIFLSLLSGAALVLTLAPGCSNNTTSPPAVAIIWVVSPGANNSGATALCGAVNDNWQIGDPEGHPIVTASTGSSSNGVPVTANCRVSPNSGGYAVNASVQYGNEGSLTVTGQINVGANAKPGPQTGISGTFNDHVPNGLIASLAQTDCTITFSKNANMGIAPTRIWGSIDCPKATATNGTVCDGAAEFLFENCEQ